MNKEKLFSRTTLFTGKKELEILQNSCVLIAGVGGLGCIVSEILVRRGLGKLILIDEKKIDLPDLNRQMHFSSMDLGKDKLRVVKEKLEKIHEFTKIEIISTHISSNDKFLDKIKKYNFQIIADCLDNYRSRFDLEKLITSSVSLVHGGVQNDFGQVTTINFGKSLKQLYTNISDTKDIIPVCPEIVFIIGSLMANEIIANLCGKPKLIDKLLIVELSDFSMFKIDIDLRTNSDL